MTSYKKLYQTQLFTTLRRSPLRFRQYWRKNWWHKLIVVVASAVLLWIGSSYGVARWYMSANNDKPLVLGTSFIPAYAESLGLDAKETMQALIDDVGVRHFRLVSYWNQTEARKGQYDFSLLDWQFQKAEKAGAKISLSIGLRQPRWPECHMPQWAAEMPKSEWQPALNAYITAVVERYKDSPSLESYQLENEFLLKSFGQCADFDRSRLTKEFALVKGLDGAHPIILSRSNNLPFLVLGKPQPDLVGTSVYRRIWVPQLRRYAEYPLPAWYYSALAGWQKIFTGKDTVIHELQAEPWTPNQKSITDTSLEEQNKSFNAARFRDRIELARQSGMRGAYLWSGEYWYYRKTKLNDDSVWNVAKEAFDRAEQRW